MDVTGARTEEPLAQENPAAGQRGQAQEQAEGVTVNSGIGAQGPATHPQRGCLFLFLTKLTSAWDPTVSRLLVKAGIWGADSLRVVPAEIMIHSLFSIFQ